jgi:hypothetical protein
MLKYGKHALVEGLSGSSGQVALPYGDDPEGRVAVATAEPPADVVSAPPRPATTVARAGRRPRAASSLTTDGPVSQ